MIKRNETNEWIKKVKEVFKEHEAFRERTSS